MSCQKLANSDCNATLALLCRYITVLYFLNDVEEGGETAFPVADNATFSKEVSDWKQQFI